MVTSAFPMHRFYWYMSKYTLLAIAAVSKFFPSLRRMSPATSEKRSDTLIFVVTLNNVVAATQLALTLMQYDALDNFSHQSDLPDLLIHDSLLWCSSN